MIDPTQPIKYDRSVDDLEEWLLFSVAVAGKTAKQIAKALDVFLSQRVEAGTPFQKIRFMRDLGILKSSIQEAHLGNWGKLEKAFSELVDADIDLKTCSVEDLEKIHGIGPKTARMFLLHSRPKQRIAALDTHILKFLATLGHKVPKTTPPSKKYAALESVFLEYCDSKGLDVAQADLDIWNSYAR